MKESEIKARIVKAVKEDGGYGRRLEDQYAVGLPDMLLAIRAADFVLMVEAKIIRGRTFGPTERQLEELRRINECGNSHLIGIMLGYKPDTKMFYYSAPSLRVSIDTCIYATTLPSLVDKLRLI